MGIWKYEGNIENMIYRFECCLYFLSVDINCGWKYCKIVYLMDEGSYIVWKLMDFKE